MTFSIFYCRNTIVFLIFCLTIWLLLTFLPPNIYCSNSNDYFIISFVHHHLTFALTLLTVTFFSRTGVLSYEVKPPRSDYDDVNPKLKKKKTKSPQGTRIFLYFSHFSVTYCYKCCSTWNYTYNNHYYYNYYSNNKASCQTTWNA